MKNTVKRFLGILLFMMVLSSILIPSSLATEKKIVSNPTSKLTTYVGLTTHFLIEGSDGYYYGPGDYNYKSSKKAVATVDNWGFVTARKAGIATITATNKYDPSDVFKLVLTVKANKISYGRKKPSTSSVPYKYHNLVLNAIQIVNPNRVDVEYYLVCNFPNSWKANAINANSLICAYTDYKTLEFLGVVIDGDSSSISGFKPRQGKFVQTIKVSYTGKSVGNTALKLSKYKYLHWDYSTIYYDEYNGARKHKSNH